MTGLDAGAAQGWSQALRPRVTTYIRWSPTAKQATFLSPIASRIREILYGGSGGGGKSVALLSAALQYVDVPGYAALLLRRTYPELSMPNALLDLATTWLAGTDARWTGDTRTWTFPSGATLTFGHLEHEQQRFRYASAEFQFIGFDELTQFTELQYRFLFSRLRRKSETDVPLRMRAASNPGGIGHDWVRQRFLTDSSTRRAFIPAKLRDNPHIDVDSYLGSLAELDPVTRRQIMDGDWSAREAGGIFRREWFEVVDQAPHRLRTVRYWDLAATAKGDWTVGCRLGRHASGDYYLLDVARLRGAPGDVDRLLRQTAALDGEATPWYVEQEPGASGVIVLDHLRRHVLAGHQVHAVRATGSKLQRAGPVSSAAQGGLVKLVRGPWIAAFLDEAEAFPQGGHDDQVDALSGAYAQLHRGRSVDGLADLNRQLAGNVIRLPAV